MARPVTPLINEATQYRREYPGPIDIDTVFDTTAERMAYLGNNFRYAGQIVADLQTQKAYMLNTARNAWIEISGGGGGGGVQSVTGDLVTGSDPDNPVVDVDALTPKSPLDGTEKVPLNNGESTTTQAIANLGGGGGNKQS
jgi:hypothetical protein